MNRFLMLAVSAASFAASAAPTVSGVSVTQDPVTRNVDIAYSLSEAAVVTVDLKKGGISIGPRRFATMVGDANRRVKAGPCHAYWRPDREIPNEDLTGLTAEVTAWPTDNPPDFMVIDLLFKNERMYYASAEAMPYDLTNTLCKTDKMVMRKIPAKGIRWHMGQGNTQGNNTGSDWRARETYHYVTFDYNYYMAIFPTTQAQFNRLTGQGVSDVNDAARYHVPVGWLSYVDLRGKTSDNIDWPDSGSTVKPDCIVDKIRSFTGLSTMDLPTESEWEFACRAGTSQEFNNGKNMSSTWGPSPDDISWDSSNAGSKMWPVGLKAGNNWGLYDCHGNGNEWCLDWYVTTPYEKDSEVTNPKGPKSSDASAPTQRVARSCPYTTSACGARSAMRSAIAPSQSNVYIGFRLKCAAEAL